MEDQINSKTNCPTCGSEVTVGGDRTTHYYIPKNTYSEEEVKALLIKHRETLAMDAYYNEKYGCVEIDTDEDDWFDKFKK